MKTETIETKKCKYCLRRVAIDKNRCPHCRKNDFFYDGAIIVRAKSKKLILLESISAIFKKSFL
jgi:RNA polymerase subunit RPABC4/transcription elongation factor Spt4